MNNLSSKKLIAIGVVFLSLSIVLFVLYLAQYPLAYKNIFKNINYDIKIPDKQNNVDTVDNKIDNIEDNFQLIIEKLSINAPIITNVDGNDEASYMKALEDGVAHLKDTALPGQDGNIFVFGHSSYYFYAPGDYKYIFAKLYDLQVGDQIVIKSSSSTYTYQIFEKRIVNPDEVNFTQSIPAYRQTLTLMTCYPTGTTLQRLIIQAEQND